MKIFENFVKVNLENCLTEDEKEAIEENVKSDYKTFNAVQKMCNYAQKCEGIAIATGALMGTFIGLVIRQKYQITTTITKLK